jgi:hypothetical protein
MKKSMSRDKPAFLDVPDSVGQIEETSLVEVGSFS